MSDSKPTALLRIFAFGLPAESVRVPAPLAGDDIDVWFEEVVVEFMPRFAGVVRGTAAVVEVEEASAADLVGEFFTWK